MKIIGCKDEEEHALAYIFYKIKTPAVGEYGILFLRKMNVCAMEIRTVVFVINSNVKLTVVAN